jgi:hypothetical protein
MDVQLLRRRVVRQKEPPSKSHLFFIGKDSHNNWVVQDQQHRCGGLFVDRAEALRFALFENGHQPQMIVMVPGVLELDMSSNAGVVDQMSLPAEVTLERRAA